MKSLLLAFLLIMLLVLNSCGKKNTSNRRETRISQPQIQEIIENQHFECASLSGPCPSGIARLFIINPPDPNKSAVCSGFMVNEKTLVTNHHCVSTVQHCKNTFMAIYNGSNYEHTRCKRIIKTMQDVEDPNDPSRKLDFTVMEIENAFQGVHFQLAHNGVSFGEILHTWVIDHTGLDVMPPNLTDSRVTEFQCIVMDQTDRASIMMMKCPIINGNSGSPVLDSDNNVVGVIWGGTATSIDSNLDLDLRRELEAAGLITETRYFKDYVSDVPGTN